MPLQILEEGTDSITSIAISDHLIVTGSVDGYVRTYDIRKGELRTDYFECTALPLLPHSLPLANFSIECLNRSNSVHHTFFRFFYAPTINFRFKNSYDGFTKWEIIQYLHGT